MMAASFALALVAALPDAFLALWLKLLGQAVLGGDRRVLLACALGLGRAPPPRSAIELLLARPRSMSRCEAEPPPTPENALSRPPPPRSGRLARA